MRPEADARSVTRGYVDPVPTPSRVERAAARFRGLDPWAVDAVLGTAFTAIGLVGLFASGDPNGYYDDPTALAVLLTLGCGLPFFFRRHAPFASLLVATVSLVGLFLFEYPTNVCVQMLLVLVYSLGAHGEGMKRPLGFAATEAGVVAVAIRGTPAADTMSVLFAGATYAAAYFLGSTVRNRRLVLEQAREREALLEREREDEARRAVADERLHIAQELHDVVAHSMGVIAVQAGVGAHVIESDPAEAKRSLEAISTTSRSTLTELRRLLGVLRDDSGTAYAPAPGLTDLEALVADLDTAGLPVEVHRCGEHTEIPPGVDFTAYRIVQEGLTNVLKHAGPARATVKVTYGPGSVEIEIVDDGRGVDGRAADGGHGLIGMRERVAVYGGSLAAGPRPGGGYRVTATLPYRVAE